MKSFWAFFTQMDKQALRALAVLLGMFAIVVCLILLGRESLNLPESEFHRFFTHIKDSGFGLPLTILTFVIAAFLGVPQIQLAQMWCDPSARTGCLACGYDGLLVHSLLLRASASPFGAAAPASGLLDHGLRRQCCPPSLHWCRRAFPPFSGSVR